MLEILDGFAQSGAAKAGKEEEENTRMRGREMGRQQVKFMSFPVFFCLLVVSGPELKANILQLDADDTEKISK